MGLAVGAAVWAVIALAGTGPAAGAPAGNGLPFGPVATNPAAATAGADRQRADEIQAAYQAGRYDEVIEAAKSFARDAKDEGLKGTVAWAMASALRKKGEWSQARGAYQKAHDLLPPGSDGYVKCDAVAEVLRASRDGVYLGPSGSAAGQGQTGTLSDDEVLQAAIVRVAEGRLVKAEAQVTAIARLRTPAEVASALGAVLEEFRRIRILKPDLGVEHEREAVKVAAGRMADLATGILAGLHEKQEALEALVAARRVRSTDKKSAGGLKAMADDLAKTEGAFAKVLAKVPADGTGDDEARLKQESADRLKEYQELSKAFAAVEAAGSDSDWNDYRPPAGRGRGR
jgi:tetratricopeptide (TPR) repeat protein